MCRLLIMLSPKTSSPAPVIDRASPVDYLMRVMDVGPAPLQVGAIVRFAPGSLLALDDLRQRVGERASATPRLRQRLVSAPLGCGWPIWVDDPAFDARNHVRAAKCAAPGDEDALLGIASHLVATPLPPERPLWQITLFTGLTNGSCALVAILHHCLVDGLGGMAVLRNLADGAAAPILGPEEFPRPRPTPMQLFLDTATTRVATARHPEKLVKSLRGVWRDIVGQELPRSPRSLTRPGGPLRAFGTASTRLAQLRAAASATGGRPDDIVLCAAAGAVGKVAAASGESVPYVVAGLSVSFRTKTASARLGNDVGTITVAVPCSGDPGERLKATAAATRGHRPSKARESMTTWAPVFSVLRALGLLRFFVQHQRFITTFVSYVPGPKRQLSVLGAPVTQIVPFSSAPGNAAATFTALSYDGQVTVTASCGPAVAGGAALLASALQEELDCLVPALP